METVGVAAMALRVTVALSAAAARAVAATMAVVVLRALIRRPRSIRSLIDSQVDSHQIRNVEVCGGVGCPSFWRLRSRGSDRRRGQ